MSELFTKSIAAQDYDLSEKLLSIYGKYVSSDITLQQIKVKKVQKSMENEKNKGLLEEDFKSLLQLIKNVGDDEKVIEELIKLLSEYTITTQEGYDFLKHIYAIDVNKQIREIIEKKLIDCTMQEVDRTGKARKIEVDLEMCYNILKKLCHEQNINEDCAKSFCKTIDRLYRQYYRKYR